MLEIGAFEAKNTLGSLLDRVERGEEVLITRHGKPVAQLVRPQPRRFTDEDRAKAEEAFQHMRVRAKSLNMGPFEWEKYKQWRDEGRP